MNYLIVSLFLCFSIIVFIKWAKITNIVDKPNDRSSHIKPTVRGAGIIFPIALLCWGLLFENSDWVLIGGVTLIGIIGFLDDKYALHQLPRLVVQSISVIMVLYVVGLSEISNVYIIVSFILITGWLNTFNFMDGINGISVLYALSILFGVFIFRESIPEIQVSLIYVVGIALLIFGFVNVRTKALAFAGDVGSLSLGLVLAYFVASLIIQTGRWEFILFLSVYGVDSVLTIIHRLIKRENIFEAHRSHLYQYLANELEFSHVLVASIYASLQFVIILGFKMVSTEALGIYSLTILTTLIGLNIMVKANILNKIKKLKI